MTYNQTILLRFIALAVLLVISCALIFTGCSSSAVLETLADSLEETSASPAPTQTVSSRPALSEPAPLPDGSF